MDKALPAILEYWGYLNPFVEITILTVIIYNVLYFLRGSRGSHILTGVVLSLIILTTVSDFLKFEVLSWMINSLWAIMSVTLIVILQPELRRAFAHLGSTSFSHRKIKKKEALNEVVIAVENMAKTKTGALIVFERQIGMSSIINSSVPLSAKLNSLLIEAIFFPNSPLHDGAIIIKNDTVVAGHAILPLSQDQALIRTLGTRHRAALGITEETDAVALVVSEETGYISIACRGRLKRDIQPDKLLRYLTSLLSTDTDSSFKNLFGTIAENDERLLGLTRTSIQED